MRGKYQTNIYSVAGDLVYCSEKNDMESLIDFSSYPKGIYFTEVNAEGKVYRNKLVLE